ncbi:MAG: penicillin acylase family protein [Planctomycetota bacterium]
MLLLVAAVSVGLFLHVRGRVLASLPTIAGDVSMPGLRAPVVIARDDRGVPSINGESFEDVVTALGFVHGQERFFQMDLTRRSVQGTLAELLGPSVVNRDIRARRLQLSNAPDRALVELAPGDRYLLERYAVGVNAGLASLGAAPPEYLLLGVDPEPWTPTDSVRTQLAIMLWLSLDLTEDHERAALQEFLPESVPPLLSTRNTSLDTPIAGAQADHNANISLPPLPSPDDVDWREQPGAERSDLWRAIKRRAPIGSNAWAVPGHRTPHGGAILAGDMHLRLSLPPTWFHAELAWGGASWSQHTNTPPSTEPRQLDETGVVRTGRYVGLTTPGGMPMLAGGSTGTIAFAFTNLHADLTDFVIIDEVDGDPSRYHTPDGDEPFGEHIEYIRVRGREDRELTIRTTRWGPVIAEDHLDRPLALLWTGRHSEAIDGQPLELLGARSVEDAISLSDPAGGPPLNMILADAHGSVAWTLVGHLPDRQGYDGLVPVSSSDESWSWQGTTVANRPDPIVNPPNGAVFSANHRTTDRSTWDVVGPPPTEPARARRIQQLLDSESQIDERFARSMQLDAMALRYAGLAELVTPLLRESDDQRLLALADALDEWDGAASEESAAYRMIRLIALTLEADVIGGLVLPAWEETKTPISVSNRDVIRRLLRDRPAHLLPPGHTNWVEYIASVGHYALGAAEQQTPERADETPWGDLNTLDVHHVLAAAVPEWLGWLRHALALPAVPQGGDRGVVRVATRRSGASNRLVVSPGHESQGTLQLPGGQSGHPLSEHFRDRFAAWHAGDVEDALLAGPPVTTFRLVPVQNNAD